MAVIARVRNDKITIAARQDRRVKRMWVRAGRGEVVRMTGQRERRTKKVESLSF
jgi:hypothetical protein